MIVLKPNLPNDTALVLLGEKYCAELEKPLEKLGVRVLPVPGNREVDPRLSSHSDLSVFHAGDSEFFLAEYLRGTVLERELIKLGFEIKYPSICYGCSYPDDCRMNICLFGENVIYNDKTASKEIIEGLSKREIKHITCNQGYAKCMVSIVDDNSVICSDKGITSACREKGIDVLGISQGHIDLDGFEYGFMGGSSFKLSKNELVFTGSLDLHPDKQRILDYLDEREIIPIFLTDRKIFDVGSIIPIIEKQR